MQSRRTLSTGLGLFVGAMAYGCGTSDSGGGFNDMVQDIVCNAPYIRHADDCCLDQNSNGICDDDESLVSVMEEEKETTKQGRECIDKIYDREGIRNFGFLERLCDYTCGLEYESDASHNECLQGAVDNLISRGGVSESPRSVGEDCVDFFFDPESDLETAEGLQDTCGKICFTYNDSGDRVECFSSMFNTARDLFPKYVNNITFTNGEIENISNMIGEPDRREAFLFPESEVRFCFDSPVSHITLVARTGPPCSSGISGYFDVTTEIDGEYVNPTGRLFFVTSCLDDHNRELELNPTLNEFIDPIFDTSNVRCFGIEYHGRVILAIDSIIGELRR